MADLNAILDSIKELKLLEVAELVKMMEDELSLLLQVKLEKLQLLCLSFMKEDSTDVHPENLWTVQ